MHCTPLALCLALGLALCAADIENVPFNDDAGYFVLRAGLDAMRTTIAFTTIIESRQPFCIGVDASLNDHFYSSYSVTQSSSDYAIQGIFKLPNGDEIEASRQVTKKNSRDRIGVNWLIQDTPGIYELCLSFDGGVLGRSRRVSVLASISTTNNQSVYYTDDLFNSKRSAHQVVPLPEGVDPDSEFAREFKSFSQTMTNLFATVFKAFMTAKTFGWDQKYEDSRTLDQLSWVNTWSICVSLAMPGATVLQTLAIKSLFADTSNPFLLKVRKITK